MYDSRVLHNNIIHWCVLNRITIIIDRSYTVDYKDIFYRRRYLSIILYREYSSYAQTCNNSIICSTYASTYLKYNMHGTSVVLGIDSTGIPFYRCTYHLNNSQSVISAQCYWNGIETRETAVVFSANWFQTDVLIT